MAHPLTQYLNDNEITRAAFAESSGVSRSTIIRFEHGRYSPRMETLMRIAKASGIKMSRLVDASMSPRDPNR